MIEINIVASFMQSDYAKAFLGKADPEWFNGFNKHIVRAMKDMYIRNEPISVNSLFKIFPQQAFELSQIYTAISSDKNIENDLLILELDYKKKKLIEGVMTLDESKPIAKIQNELSELLERSRISILDRSYTISQVTGQVIDDLSKAIERGDKLQGISTGWRLLDKYMGGYHKGNLIIIGGRPGLGKTALGLSLAVDCCKWANVLFYTMEMSKEEIAQRYISYFSGIENYKVRNASLEGGSIESISEKLYQTNQDFHIIDSTNRHIDHITSQIRLHRVKFGLDIVVIDYLQLIDGNAKSRYEIVSDASKRLKQLAKELGITVIALAQLKREEKADVKPSLSDLKESGQLEQDADVVLFPYRPAYYLDFKPEIEYDAELIIAKNRHGQCGAIDVIFEGKFTRYKENNI
jgi:replicative DNA helicase